MKTYYQGGYAKLEVKCRVAGVLTDPATSFTIGIEDSTGTNVVASATTMTKSSTGIYYYAYAIGATAKLGTYTYEAIFTDTSWVSKEQGQFKVAKKIVAS